MDAYQLIGRGLFFGALSAALVVACGDDETSDTTSAASGTTTTTGGGGSGGASTTATTGSGGTPNVLCELDGYCDPSGGDAEDCACPDCWNASGCLEGGCQDNGACDPKEPCHCTDCAADPHCADYCVSCRNFTSFFPPAEALCNEGAPSSASLWSDLEACACGGVCTTECSVTLCNGSAPSADCQTCLEENCQAERDACVADIRPHVLCNPISIQPCKAGNAVCDVRTRAAKLIGSAGNHPEVAVGFECFIRETSEAGLCEACSYTSNSNSYCPRGQTCVDGDDALTEMGSCGKYCCDDADCAGGVCLKGAFDTIAPALGTCAQDVGAGGAGGAGGSGGAPAIPGCDESAETPSNGSCVTLTQ